MGIDASVDTHRAVQHNSVQPKYGAHGAGPKEVVKPDGHVVPAG